MYDTNNIFSKILRGEVPCKKVAKGQHFLSFHDVNPKATVHVQIIPTGAYINAHDFAENATAAEQTGFWQGVDETIKILKLKEKGYRLIMNTGVHGRQEVPHLHMHILGGNDVGPMVAK
jgi:histidine triad (HIT) family protein